MVNTNPHAFWIILDDKNRTSVIIGLEKYSISSSPEWKNLDQGTKDRLGHADKGMGEWWMTYDDFKENFEEVSICIVGPGFDDDAGASINDK